MSHKLTGQPTSVSAVLKQGTYLKLPFNIRMIQNTHMRVEIEFFISGALSRTFLLGGFYSELMVDQDGALYSTSEYGASDRILVADSIKANTWYNLVIENYKPGLAVTINGSPASPYATYWGSPFNVEFIGRGRTDIAANLNLSSGASALIVKKLNIRYGGITLLDFYIPSIPQETDINTFIVGNNIPIKTTNYLNMGWVENYEEGGILLTDQKVSTSGQFNALIEFRDTRTLRQPGKLTPLLTKKVNATTHSGFFLSELGVVVLAKDIVSGQVPNVYPSVGHGQSNTTRYLGLATNWTGAWNASWEASIRCAFSQGAISYYSTNSVVYPLLGVINGGASISLAFSPEGVTTLRLLSTTGILVSATVPTIQANTLATYSVQSTGTAWVLFHNGVELARVVSSSATMYTNNMIGQISGTLGNNQDRYVYFEAVYLFGGSYAAHWKHVNYNPLSAETGTTSEGTTAQRWISHSNPGAVITLYRDNAYFYPFYDPTGKLLHVFPNHNGSWYPSIPPKYVSRINLIRTASNGIQVSYGGFSLSDTAILSYLGIPAAALLSAVDSIGDLDCILGGGYADFYGASISRQAGDIISVWVDETGVRALSGISSTNVVSETSAVVQDIPTPQVHIVETGETFTRLDLATTSIANSALSRPVTTVEISGRVLASNGGNIWLGPNQSTNFNKIVYKAAEGQEFKGKLFDDSVASLDIQMGTATSAGLGIAGAHDLTIQDLILYAQSARGGAIGGYSNANVEPLKVTRTGICLAGTTGSTAIHVYYKPVVVTDSVVYWPGAIGITNSQLGSKFERITVGQAVNSSSSSFNGIELNNATHKVSCLVVRNNVTPAPDYSSTLTNVNCGGTLLTSQHGATLRDFVDYHRGDLRVKPNSRLYNAGVGAFSLGAAPNVGNYTLDSLAVSGTGPDLLYPNSHAIDNAMQEVIKAFQTAANISSTRTQSKDISVTYAVLANIVQSILQQKGITKSFSDIANEITGIAGSKTITNYRNVIAQVVASASAGSKTTLSNIAINAAINAQYTHLALMGAMGTFATQVSVIRTIMANKTAVATYGSQAQVSRTGSQTKTTTKAHATSGTFSSTRTTQKGVTASFITTGIATRQGSQTKQVTKSGTTSAVESSLFYASKTVTKGYASSANITRWSTYIKLYEILGTFFSSGVFSSNNPSGSKTATGSYTRSVTANTVRTTSKHMEKSFSDLANVSSLRVTRKEVALPLTPSSATLNTNYTIEKTSYVGYNTYLVITSEMRGTSKDVAKKLATYITESDSIIKYTSAVTSIEQYSVKLFRNTAEYQTQQISEYSLGESNVIAASVTYKTQSSSIARY